MTALTTTGEISAYGAAPPLGYAEARWYVAQTCARHEKRVAEQLASKGVEHFLPLYETVSRWKDRRVHLRLPLFECYIFVRFPLRDRLRTLEIPSVVRLVSFNGLPTALSDVEVESLRSGIDGRIRIEPHPYLTIGRRVRIVRGPLDGSEGILVRRKGSLRVIVSVSLIMRSVAVEVDSTDIESVR